MCVLKTDSVGQAILIALNCAIIYRNIMDYSQEAGHVGVMRALGDSSLWLPDGLEGNI